VQIDSFSGLAAELRGAHRTSAHVLRALAHDPKVSTWDMDAMWLRNAIDKLKRLGLIEAVAAAYPWHRYAVTEAGHKHLAGNTPPEAETT
jgi:hypothetical protein